MRILSLLGAFVVARRLAPGALDLQPWKAAIDGLVDGGRRIDRLAVAPHSFVPALAKQLVGLLDHRFALSPHLRGLRGQDAGHRTFLVQSLAVAAR
jgi:hypothetical protein